jgi:hypothetical protein
MILQKKIICKIEIRIDEKYIQYKQKQSQESWNKLQNNHNVYTHTQRL